MQKLFLYAICLVAGYVERIGNEGGHARIDLREQIVLRRVQRVVEVEDPTVYVGKFFHVY